VQKVISPTFCLGMTLNLVSKDVSTKEVILLLLLLYIINILYVTTRMNQSFCLYSLLIKWIVIQAIKQLPPI